MKTLVQHINEWKITDRSIKTVDYSKDNEFFTYDHTKHGHIKIFGPDWDQLYDYTKNVYDIKGNNIKIDDEGLTEDVFNPGIYKFKIKDIDKIVSCYNMFEYCTELIKVPVFDTSKVETMRNMFYECDNLLEAPFFNTSNAEDISGMFLRCIKIKKSPKYNTSKATDVGYMFYQCPSITDVPLFTNLDFTRMEHMFDGCPRLNKNTIMKWSKVYDFKTDDKIL